MADALAHLSSGRTRIEWLSSLNTEFVPQKNYRRTSIICTIGLYKLRNTTCTMPARDLPLVRPEDQFGGKDQYATQR